MKLNPIQNKGLRLKYTNRSGESLAYPDEGYIDLNHVKNLSLTSNIVVFPEEVRTQVKNTLKSKNIVNSIFTIF